MGGKDQAKAALVHHKHWYSGWFLQHETILTINFEFGYGFKEDVGWSARRRQRTKKKI